MPPFLSLPNSHPTCQTPCPHSSGSRKQDPRNGSAPVRVFIAVFCQHVVFQLHIYIFTFSSVTHGFSVWLKSGGGGWIQRVAGVGGGDRWPGTAPKDLRAQPRAFLPQLRNHLWLPTALRTKSRPPGGAWRGACTLHSGKNALSSWLQPSVQGKGARRSSAPRKLCDLIKCLYLSEPMFRFLCAGSRLPSSLQRCTQD